MPAGRGGASSGLLLTGGALPVYREAGFRGSVLFLFGLQELVVTMSVIRKRAAFFLLQDDFECQGHWRVYVSFKFFISAKMLIGF